MKKTLLFIYVIFIISFLVSCSKSDNYKIGDRYISDNYLVWLDMRAWKKVAQKKGRKFNLQESYYYFYPIIYRVVDKSPYSKDIKINKRDLSYIILAQMINETGWFSSSLVKERNLLGIKWKDVKLYSESAYIEKRTWEELNNRKIYVKDKFAVFHSFAYCVDIYLYKIAKQPVYQKVRNSKSPDEYMQNLVGTYATDSRYYDKVYKKYLKIKMLDEKYGKEFKKKLTEEFLQYVDN